MGKFYLLRFCRETGWRFQSVGRYSNLLEAQSAVNPKNFTLSDCAMVVHEPGGEDVMVGYGWLPIDIEDRVQLAIEYFDRMLRQERDESNEVLQSQ